MYITIFSQPKTGTFVYCRRRHRRHPFAADTTVSFTPFLVENLPQLLVRTVDDSPAEKGPSAVHTYALVDVPQLPIAFVVHQSQRGQHAFARTTDSTLHRHLQNVDRVEHRTDKCAYARAGQELLRTLCYHCVLCVCA